MLTVTFVPFKMTEAFHRAPTSTSDGGFLSHDRETGLSTLIIEAASAELMLLRALTDIG